ncbi:hypothetical protein CRUP_030606 [Coryphaenoides rupestris]|nr:hypothetical protein CRUP_030606 [Coryphaenoides rupestris]
MLGDYDKVKTISSGSDCVCRCIVQPIKRSDCDGIHDDDTTPREFYTVETVTMGTDCQRCECLAPPSAVNPCEGEYRFRKLQELSSILDLLEASMFGMDLLKLHSVTTELLDRMDNMETFAHNLTERQKEKERAKERAKEREKTRRSQQRQDKKNTNVAPKKKNPGSIPEQQPITVKMAQPFKDKAGAKQPMREHVSTVVRGVSFYMAGGAEDGEQERREGGHAEHFISDQKPPTPQHLDRPAGGPTASPQTHTRPDTQTSKTHTRPDTQTSKTHTRPDTQTSKAHTRPDTQIQKRRLTPPSTMAAPTIFQPHPTTHTVTNTTSQLNPESTPMKKTTTATPTTSSTTSMTRSTATTPPQPAKPSALSPSIATLATGKTRLSWTESSADKHTPTKKPGNPNPVITLTL